MNVYRDANGVWVGTQAQAGNKDVIDIPTTSKSDMLEWLNANCRENNSGVSMGVRTSTPINNSPPDSGKCPKCRMTPAGAQMAAAGIVVDAIGKRIETAPPWEAIRLMESVLWRITEIKNDADKLRKSVGVVTTTPDS